jgi:predicted ATP-grasp superfamily ATP-dependent carboligase
MEASTGQAGAIRTILLGFAQSLAAPEVAWSLADAGHRVLALNRRGQRPALRRSRAVSLVDVTPPEADADAACADLVAATMRLGVDAFMPLDDLAVWLGERTAAQIGATVVGPVGDQARMALDKRLQLASARLAGLSVPATAEAAGGAPPPDVRAFPVVAKPALAAEVLHGRLTRGTGRACADRRRLEEVLGTATGGSPWLVQPLVGGLGEGLFGIAGQQGPDALSAHRRIRMMNPAGSGSSACVSAAVEPVLAAAAARMLEQVDWRGLFMLEFLRDADGRPWFMELNGRAWGSMALARRTGFDYPAWAVAHAFDPTFVPPTPAPIPPVTCRHLGREIVHVLFVLRGRTGPGPQEVPSRGRTLRAVLRVRRSDRWYNWRSSEPGLFLDDAMATVRDAALGGNRR